MVYGLEKFKEYFEGLTDQYVFIGGTACDILMKEIGAPFRATKDLDIVLIIEVLDASFGERFWQFIEDGGYEYRGKSPGRDQFYRFSKPNKTGYPTMIELFSRESDDFKLKFENGLTPIHIDESVVSLSAILLNDVYYDLLISGKEIVDGYSIIDIETAILFKIKAWLDMKERLDRDEQVDSRNIKKHKNDIFRLLANVDPSSKVEIDKDINKDIRIFVNHIDLDRPDLKNLGIKDTGFEEMMELLLSIYS
jgi:hypothetical protein